MLESIRWNRPLGVTQNRPTVEVQDIASAGSVCRLPRHEQCLERRKKTTSHRTREARMAFAAHRASHWCASRNSQRLPEGGRRCCTAAALLGKRTPTKPAKEVTPDFIAPFSAKPAVRSTCEAHRELIEQGLSLGRNSKAIWQDLVSDHGFAGGYQAVKRFVRKLRGPAKPGSGGHHRHGTGRRSTSRLPQRSDSA
jgi:hypothetical protein